MAAERLKKSLDHAGFAEWRSYSIVISKWTSTTGPEILELGLTGNGIVGKAFDPNK
jgi:hypothetical protein